MNQSSSPNTDETNVHWSKIVLGVFLYLIVLVTIFGNILVLVAVKSNKRLQTVFNFYVVNLALTDVSVAVTAMSFYTLDNILGYWPFGRIMCGVWIFFDYGMTFASVFTLCIISIDRFWAVNWPIHYKSHHNKKKALGMICGVWLFTLMVWLPPCIMDRVQNYITDDTCIWDPALNQEMVIVIGVVGHHGSFFLLFGCYLRVLFVVRRQRKIISAETTVDLSNSNVSRKNQATNCTVSESDDIPSVSVVCKTDNNHLKIPNLEKVNSTNSESRSTNNNHQTARNQTNDTKASKAIKDSRVFITLTYIIVGYIICWVPFHVVYDVTAIRPDLVSDTIYSITFWLTYINSTLNPFLYNFGSPEFRSAFREILRGRHL
ncbi:alpha-2B adrenergic receptor-like [Saccostrea echinata]|uniref:alpha-2B adrenergic receptor-like n=1 Tax=Saccostrea echinata TaxID=191078 RepID=UPI002A83BFC2|nr:alpha-2B adrenergic receptor-like [Saccostrea echinata]